MKAVILAAGRGSRMAGLTDDRPKCLTELGGKPLLFWQLLALREANIKDVAVVTGYRADDIASLTNKAPVPFTVLSNPQWAETNMLSTLFCAEEWARGDDCIVSYSDIVYPAEHVRALDADQAPIVITYDGLWEQLWKLRQEDPLIDAETFREENGRLLEIGGTPKTLSDVKGQYMGLIRIAPEGWQIFSRQRGVLGEQLNKTDMTSFFRRLLAADVPIGAVRVEGRWCEVDSGKDVDLYEAALAGGCWSHDWRNEGV